MLITWQKVMKRKFSELVLLYMNPLLMAYQISKNNAPFYCPHLPPISPIPTEDHSVTKHLRSCRVIDDFGRNEINNESWGDVTQRHDGTHNSFLRAVQVFTLVERWIFLLAYLAVIVESQNVKSSVPIPQDFSLSQSLRYWRLPDQDDLLGINTSALQA